MKSLLDRITERSRRDPDTGCLRWLGKRTAQGYGRIKDAGRDVAVHRAVYTANHGPIPDGFVIDHVHARGCRHRDCVEPDHLEAVTQAENVRRAVALITHCPQGHPYDESNTFLDRGNRSCRTCYRAVRKRPRECPMCGDLVSSRNHARHVARHRADTRRDEVDQ